MKATKNPDFSQALCAQDRYRTSYYNWFPELDEFIQEEKSRRVCYSCPIRFDCAQYALQQREPWGIWGGMEEFRVRRALGLDAFGNNRVYSRELVCPFCGSTDLTKARKKGTIGYLVECNQCSITWDSYKIPDKVRKTLRRVHDGNVERSVDSAGEEG